MKTPSISLFQRQNFALIGQFLHLSSQGSVFLIASQGRYLQFSENTRYNMAGITLQTSTYANDLQNYLWWVLILLLLLSSFFVYHYKGVIQRLTQELNEAQRSERQLRSQMKLLADEKAEVETGLQTVLAVCPDFICIYSSVRLQPVSQAFRDLSPFTSSYWYDSLEETCFNEFQEKTNTAMQGNATSMQVNLKRPYSPGKILPLSPLLDIFQDRSDTVMDLEMRPLYWGGPAVLIHMQPCAVNTSILDFLKMVNHEFRTPINTIIGLSDLMTEDSGDRKLFEKRQKLLRLSASVLLAMVNSIIHQCELTWKMPTGLPHIGFNPRVEIETVVAAVNEKISARGNSLELHMETNGPDTLWGDIDTFRRFLYFILSTCSGMTSHDRISLTAHFTQYGEKCCLNWELEAHCLPLCSSSDFRSILELLSGPECDFESEASTSMLKEAERKALLSLSIAREMSRLLLGDLTVVESDHLVLKFSASFSMRKEFVFKRKRRMFSETEEFLPVVSEAYSTESLEVEEDLTPMHRGRPSIGRHFSEIAMHSRSLIGSQSLSVRRQTFPNHQSFTEQLPFNPGDDSPQNDSSSRPVTALVADDVPSNAMVLSGMLKRLGVISTVVYDGVEAVNFVKTHKPDVIFMDCEMPVMNGFEAAQLIRAIHPTIPIVAVTANGPEYATKCYEVGMSYFFTKPVRLPLLKALLEKLNLQAPVVAK